jgi:hypothetical protein
MTDDALLAALADARRRKDQAARDMRLLLAYAREIITPRLYRLADLAQATGMSISGIRVAYSHRTSSTPGSSSTTPWAPDTSGIPRLLSRPWSPRSRPRLRSLSANRQDAGTRRSAFPLARLGPREPRNAHDLDERKLRHAQL